MLNARRFRGSAALRGIGSALLLGLWLAGGSQPAGAVDGAPSKERVQRGVLALYDFRSIDGSIIKDRSGAKPPLNLRVSDPKAVRQTERGLEIVRQTLIRSEQQATRLSQAIKKSGAITIEAWIRPAKIDQSGPARIMTLSHDPNTRNFTLGQDANKFEARLRTTKTSSNGIPAVASKPKSLKSQWTHVVYARDDAGRTRIFINGKLDTERTIGGAASNWDESFHIGLGNELSGDRPWLGAYRLAAIYDRSLAPNEVEQNFRAGAEIAAPTAAELATLDRERNARLFETQIAPLLSQHCLECHDAPSRKGGLDLSNKAAALAGGESGAALVAGKASDSPLWRLVESDEMPHDRPALSKADKAAIKQWLDGGATWSLDAIDPAVYANGEGAQKVFVQRLTVPEYIETVRSAVGVDIAKEARELLPRDLRADGFSNTAYNLNVDLAHVEAYARLAQITVDRMDVLKLAGRFSKSRSLNTDATARKFVAAVGEWLFRGALEEREITNYSGILTAAASAGAAYEQGVALMLEAMLQSPRFIYRIERHRGDGAERAVGEYELASRLSYIVWGGPPDAELLRAAQEGRLSNRERCREQTRRMLKDPRAVERSKRFIADWLNLDRLANMRPDAKRFPNWEPALAQDMRDETIEFFEEVVWRQNRPLTELFNAQFTFATPRLARHYGLKPKGDGLQRYDLLSVAERGGLLTQGSVLTIGGDDASMVTRGLFLLQDVLRGVIGAPPPGVDTTPVLSKPGMSLRKIAEQRLSNVSCGGCHKRFEPLAFGLEQYDGIGAFFKKDRYGNPLRSDGELVIPGAARSSKYGTAAELMDLLARSDRVRETMTWKLTQFALGRPLGAADASVVTAIHKAAQKAGGTYSSLVTEIVMSDLVQKVRTEASR